MDSKAIRDCSPHEAAALLRLWRESGASPSATDSLEDVSRAISCMGAVVLVAEESGRLIGSVIGGFDGWRGSLYRLVVHPDFRRRGIARTLVEAAQKRLVQIGARRITAMVEKDNSPALAFWKAVGFTLDERMTRFVHNKI
jgi:ribosomal protein S18 acetylase RimI-like enzyme